MIGEPLYKDMIIAKPIGKFVNGPHQGGVITRERLVEYVEKQKRHPRQIPIYLLGEHPPTNDLRPADGWVEGLSIDDDGNLVASAKLIGQAAEWVREDRIRGASIYTRQGADYLGNSMGDVLRHVLLSDEAFISDLNVSASDATGGVEAVIAFTALTKEADMADKKEPKDPDPSPADKAKVSNDDAPTALKMKEAQDAITALQAEKLVLKERIEDLETSLANSKVDVDKETLARENLSMRAEVFGMKVRALVADGLQRGTLKPAWCDGFAGKNAVDYAGTVQWLKASRFYDRSVPNPEDAALRLVKWAVENNQPLYKTGVAFISGQPVGDTGAVSLTDAQRATLKDRGMDPDRVANITDETNFADWKRMKAEGGGK